MDEELHNSQIEKIANMMVDDSVSIDEQDQDKLQNTKTKQFLIAIKGGMMQKS